MLLGRIGQHSADRGTGKWTLEQNNMKQKKYILTIFLACFYALSFGQNKSFTIGLNDNGLSFGNSENTNGLRFNLWDNDDVNRINGLNFSIFSKARISNGLTFGLLSVDESICNGIAINGFFGGSNKANGIIISGGGYATDQFNGLGIGGLGLAGERMNGLFISPMTIGYWSDEKVKLINGVAIGTFSVSVGKINGLSISVVQNYNDEQNGVSIGIVNKSKKLHGIQLGIWNIAENNKIFKRFPKT